MIRTLSSSILIIPYFLMLVIGLTIPSIAYRGIFNPKSLIFVTTINCLFLYLFLRQRLKICQLNVILFVLLNMTFLLLWLLIGAIDDSSTLSTRIDHLKLFIITLTVPCVTLFLLNESKISAQAVFKTVIYSNLAYCSIKLVVVIFQLLGVIDIWDISEALGFRIMKMTIFGTLQRLQSTLDISTPFILLFVLQSEYLGLHLSRRIKGFYIVVSLLSNFLAFSRFLLFVYAASFTLYLMSQSLTRLTKGLVIAFVILVSLVGILGSDNLATSIHHRFFSKANYFSDHTRQVQYDVLMQEHDQTPFLGKGLGGYSRDLIRDKEVKHSYEMQWVATLMQFGLVGIALLLIPIGLIIFRFIQYPLTRVNLSFLCLFFLWILSGFTNPFLLSLQSGIMYTLFLITPFFFAENVR